MLMLSKAVHNTLDPFNVAHAALSIQSVDAFAHPAMPYEWLLDIVALLFAQQLRV